MITSNTNQSRYIPIISEEMFILEKLKERVTNLNPDIDTEWVRIIEKKLENLVSLNFLVAYFFNWSILTQRIGLLLNLNI